MILIILPHMLMLLSGFPILHFDRMCIYTHDVYTHDVYTQISFLFSFITCRMQTDSF
ncbi:hypothetical protein FSA03_12520 [Bacteroides fragilis]|uniref:Transmembrane protein n=1 Tax=Bacteroides fragilis TaxID=817 RepID=A0AB38PSE3_BACFG|nr:hypothetical protein F9Z90_10625 [Bacteroides fragilis]TWV41140.1 hypothetical protein FSA06_13505 [Bacteroides fragilis]TWV48247.1 hypothetical protein FSA03_12520 [Bacteroides fragilis]